MLFVYTFYQRSILSMVLVVLFDESLRVVSFLYDGNAESFKNACVQVLGNTSNPVKFFGF